MKTFTEELVVVGDYYVHPTHGNPDVIDDPYQMPLAGRHMATFRIFTERQRSLTNYRYDFEFTCTDEESFYEGLEANCEWAIYSSFQQAAGDLEALLRKGIIYEEAHASMQANVLSKVA